MNEKELIERMNNKMKKGNAIKVPVNIIDDDDYLLCTNVIGSIEHNEKRKSDKELIDKLNHKLGCDIAKGKDNQSFAKIDYSPDDEITLMPHVEEFIGDNVEDIDKSINIIPRFGKNISEEDEMVYVKPSSKIVDKQTERLENSLNVSLKERYKNFVIKTRIQEIRNYIQSIEELLTDIEDYLK